MKYTDVVQLMKQAADFAAAVAAQAKARQQQIARANSKYTQTTGKQPAISNVQANQIIDDSVRRRVAADAAKRKAADIRYNEFIAEQRRQNQARAARTNAIIAKQQAADQKRVTPTLRPMAEPKPVQAKPVMRNLSMTPPAKSSYQAFNRNNLSGYNQDQINAINAAAQRMGIKSNQISKVRFGANGQVTGINGIGI